MVEVESQRVEEMEINMNKEVHNLKERMSIIEINRDE